MVADDLGDTIYIFKYGKRSISKQNIAIKSFMGGDFRVKGRCPKWEI